MLVLVIFIQILGIVGATNSPLIPSARSNIESFKVMDVLARAVQLEEEGQSICHMEGQFLVSSLIYSKLIVIRLFLIAGQPGSSAPKRVIQKAHEALDNDLLGYTSALGITALRSEISKHYLKKYNLDISPNRIVVTTGSSAGFILTFLAAFDEGASGTYINIAD